jgi:DNA-binding winged helix-turn-helix (wHTH) protein
MEADDVTAAADARNRSHEHRPPEPGDGSPPAESAVSFGPFDLLPRQRLVLKGGRPLRLGGRALDLLIALVERAGELVSKDDLMARVWPDTYVEEDNLRAQVAALRRALSDGRDGARYVATVVGRGYWFVAPVARSTSERSEWQAYDRLTFPSVLNSNV